MATLGGEGFIVRPAGICPEKAWNAVLRLGTSIGRSKVRQRTDAFGTRCTLTALCLNSPKPPFGALAIFDSGPTLSAGFEHYRAIENHDGAPELQAKRRPEVRAQFSTREMAERVRYGKVLSDYETRRERRALTLDAIAGRWIIFAVSPPRLAAWAFCADSAAAFGALQIVRERHCVAFDTSYAVGERAAAGAVSTSLEQWLRGMKTRAMFPLMHPASIQD